MASSDNVLRGGLTPKNVDLEELLRVVRFGQDPIEILEPVPRSLAERVYETPASEFELSVIDLSNEVTFESGARAGVEILLCLKGAASIRLARDGSHSELAQGQSVLIPDAAGAVQAVGEARIYRAAVPLIR
jgi:mannose-6-phosphate isomerase